MTQTLETTANANSYYEIALTKIYATAKDCVDKAEHGRLQRALEYALMSNVYEVDGDQWEARNGDGKTYTLDVAARECNCPDYQRRELPCKHLYSARLVQRAMVVARQSMEDNLDESNSPEVAQPTTHNEAPFSWTYRDNQTGEQWTIRAHSEQELMGKVISIRKSLNTQTGSNGIAAKALCPVLQIEMAERDGKYGKFFSHKDADGWCNGR